MPAEKKFKVCLVSISLAKGGLERSCAMLSEMLETYGHDVHLVILNDEVDYPYSGKMLNLGKMKAKKDSMVKRLLRFRKFRNYLKNEKFDLIIDHRPKNNFERELFYSKFIYRELQKIYVVHSSKKAEYLTENPSKFSKICQKNILNVAVSEYIENEILKKEGINNSVTIHNAFNPKWENESGDFPKILQNKKYILSYGRLDDSIKDFSFLIEAFSQSKVWEKEVQLVILGDGKDKEKLQKLAFSKPCAEQILFLPFTKSPFEIIKNARCVTLTSKYEGFPMVLVESLSLGTPVVSLNIISGPSEIVQHQKNGLLITERSLPLFSEALQTLCFDEQLYETLKKNAKPSVEKFSMQAISEKWNQTLQHAIP
ncbi:glycosyltransferase [Aequorivita sp. CIP111184]|uniref:glycosyltransferase n=1 Tax=Aequorivita sp. CIP111184 TaxID=2211356 RepID=UPI000DBC4664|nr:glycosyltransferase [Aequorivita sp. CIP111184]SRX54772.1 N-acetylgalactosamine-N, N'-diacetylbacillosaminyl-diphospho-undecaprenol 4-alpha-N-acetylgalactosaminyltransferase [Aequorivita sp. CIP111184]